MINMPGRKSNPLLMGLILVSLGLHVILFMRIAGIYKSRNVSVIELTVEDTSRPFVRNIPRPRVRHKIPVVNTVRQLQVPEYKVPQIKIDPVETPALDAISEKITLPDTPRMKAPDVATWKPVQTAPAAPAAPDSSMTRRDFFDMLRLKIEQSKKYPESARTRHREGRVVVRFIISPNGEATSVEIAKSAGHASLDRAAVNAVKKASPFPSPPADMFQSRASLQLEISIVFELM